MMVNNLLLGFPGGSVVRTCLPMQETQVQSLGREDPLKKEPPEMATHSSILGWEIHAQRSLILQSMGFQKNPTQFSD